MAVAPARSARNFIAEASGSASGGVAPRAHPNSAPKDEASLRKLLRTVHRGTIGESSEVATPVGARRITYADHTASGRSLSFIEEYMTRQVAVMYANTHTSSSQTGFQTSMFRIEAREMVKRAVGATDKDALLFLGNGATGAAHVLVHFLQIRKFALEAVRLAALARSSAKPATTRTATSLPGAIAAAMQAWGTPSAADAEPSTSATASADKPEFVTPGSMTGSFATMRAPGMAKGSVHFVKEAEHALAHGEAGDGQASGSRMVDAALRPLVLVGPYAHHSSLLPWREAGADVCILPEAKAPLPPGVDLAVLDERLRAAREEGRPLIAGVLSAASNITGVLVDTLTPTALLHHHGALAVWDYAAAAPHAPVVVNPGTGSVIDAGRSGDSPSLGGDVQGAAEVLAAAAAQGIALDGSNLNTDKDAAFFSPHKFPGGPGTPGVLVVKKALLLNPVPAVPGGGTVFFVHRDGCPRYLANIEEREEGGTPNITGSIRAGLVMRLHSAVGPSFIRAREAASLEFALERWRRHPNVAVLGRTHAARCAIISMIFLCRPAGAGGSGLPDDYRFAPHHNDADSAVSVPVPAGGPLKGPAFGDDLSGKGSLRLLASGRRALHWSFAATLLADLFGIQARGGCLCAGPYALRLLSLTQEDSDAIEGRLMELEELLRPGFVRLSIPYHMPAHAVRFIVGAVEFVATHGADLLPLYAARSDTGEYRHTSWRHVDKPRKWLHMVSFESGEMEVQDGFHDEFTALPGDAAIHAGRRAMIAEAAAAAAAAAAAQADDGASEGGPDATGSASATATPPSTPASQAGRRGRRVKVSKEAEAAVEAIRVAARSWLAQPLSALDAVVVAEAEKRATGALPGRAAPSISRPLAVGKPAAAAGTAAGQPALATDPEEAAELDDFATYFADAAAEVDQGRAMLARRGAGASGLLGDELVESLLSEPARQLRWFAVAGEQCEAAPTAAAEAVAEAVAEAGASGAAADETDAGAAAAAASGAGASTAASSAGAAAGTQGDDDSDSDSDSEQGDGLAMLPMDGDLLGDDQSAADAKRLEEIRAAAAAETLRLTGREAVPLTGSLAGFAPAAARFLDPPARLLSRVRHTVLKYRMIWPGDRVVLGLSGGKDSLSCLHLLAALRKVLPFDFELHCCTIDPQSPGFDPTPLIGYCSALGVPYHLESDDIIGAAGRCMDKKHQSICAFCSRMKRGMLYSACRRERATVLALAQHMDDLAESLLMSTFHNGLLRTMKAHYRNAEGDIRVIRPLVMVRERALRDFASTSGLPVIEDNCPACFAAPTERYRTKQLLRAQEQLYPSIIENIGKALGPLLRDSSWPALRKEGDASITAAWPEFASYEALSAADKRAIRRRALAAEKRQRKEGALSTVSAATGAADTDDVDGDLDGFDGADDSFAADGGVAGADGDDIDEDEDGGLLSPAANKGAIRLRLGAGLPKSRI
ncbi:hypothetical protein FNF28_05752 [Cafeteria roenbergensis]|uniref:tRNA(Ile)-lysidine/2-thiocytidine synthase N-terminal domain-containing protein n=1 Tax=Cafeteria roenbergensis TaxID=33653 RepID=A0A5A8D2H8_CAFRO|nr:hypothetical protein FNF28_05752 [Cafeteria roenbergensis]